MKNICLLWQAPYPWDVRIEKFVDALAETGCVHVLCRKKKGAPLRSEFDGCTIERVNAERLPCGFLRRALEAPLPFNPLWLRRCILWARERRASLIIVRDLPIAWLALIAGKVLRIPVVFDMAENYPAALKAYNKKRYRLLLLGNALLPRLYERAAVNHSARILVVAEEQRARLLRQGVPAEKIYLVLNTPRLGEVHLRETGGPRRLTLLYTGKIDAHRGVDTAIRAMALIVRRYPSARLVLAGDGTQVERLRALAGELGVRDNVDFRGWVSHAAMYDCIRESTVCLIPHLKSEHTDTTIPNKLFDYMALARPVITANLAPVERIVRAHRCGLVFGSGDPGCLAGQVERLLTDCDLNEMGVNGRRAVLERYHWETDAQTLRSVIASVTGEPEEADTVRREILAGERS